MIIIRITAILILMLASLPASAQASFPGETRFFTILSDVPVMPGMNEVPGRDMEFDKPEGRIAESTALAQKTDINGAQVQDFYDRSLPQLGWVKTGPGLFTRQNEQMTVQTSLEQARTRVRLTVSPH
jgi:hypothetical protein